MFPATAHVITIKNTAIAKFQCKTLVTAMGFRFRLGPFTFGRSGARLSLWAGGLGFSTPLAGKGRTFGKVGIGPFSWYGQSRDKQPAKQPELVPSPDELNLTAEEANAIVAVQSDQRFLDRLRRYGMPWRGVQERLKEELAKHHSAPDQSAYEMVPKAMTAVFGQQGHAWRTEKRKSRSGPGFTTWIVVD